MRQPNIQPRGFHLSSFGGMGEWIFVFKCSHHVPRLFPKFPMCFPRVFPAAPHFIAYSLPKVLPFAPSPLREIDEPKGKHLILNRNPYFGEPTKFQFFMVIGQSKINNKQNFEGSSHLMNRRGNHS
jgi:hypothetical protein